MLSIRSLLVAAAIGLSLGHVGNVAAQDADKAGMVTGIADKKVSIAPFDDQQREDRLKTFACSSDDVQKAMSRVPEAGDQVVYKDSSAAKDEKEGAAFRCASLRARVVHIDVGTRALVIAFAAVVVLGAAFYATYGHPLRFLIGTDGRYSNSQCQLALWFGVAMTMYVAMVVLRIHYLGANFIDGVALTANVMTLTGLSAFTFGAAKAVSAQKADSASTKAGPAVASVAANTAQSNGVVAPTLTALQDAITKAGSDKAVAIATQVLTDAGSAAAVAPVVAAIQQSQQTTNPKPPALGAPSLRKDLFQNDMGEVDLGDFQMILIALAAAVVWGVSCFLAMESLPFQVHVSLPDIDTSLLAGFGIGQGAYLVKKAATAPNKG